VLALGLSDGDVLRLADELVELLGDTELLGDAL
jgi:hypothetical protein